MTRPAVKPHLLKRRGGFTMLEMLFACCLMAIIMAGVFNTAITVMKNDKLAATESEMYMSANRAVERTQRGADGLAGLIKARESSIAIDISGRSVTFSVDQNNPYTAAIADDTSMKVYLEDVDGVFSTTGDNSLMLDPNTAIAGNEIRLCTGVSALSFSKNDRLVTMNLELERTVRGSSIKVSVQQDIYVRN